LLLWLLFSDGAPPWLKYAAAISAPVLLWLLWRSVALPQRMSQRGMELLSAQEANNRLAPVGQPDADRIASLFNTLMERLHRERLRLREQNVFLDQLIQASPMGVALMDFDRHLTLVNESFLKLASVPDTTDPIGRMLSQLPGDVMKCLDGMADGETRTIRREDHLILRCYRLSFLENGFRRPFVLLESLTEEVMRAQRQAYGKIIRLMAHEVNNSMTGINTLLDVLLEAHADDAELSDFISSVSERSAAMSRFIGAYADVVRLPEPMLATIDLKEFISSNLPFLRSNSPYPVEADLEGDNLNIEADSDMLSQTLVNIIKNSAEAIKAAVSNHNNAGRILISAYREGRDITLTVTDSGCGISPDTAANLFNPFFSTKPDGQGIGLTMVAEILRRHKAEFSLRTDTDGLTRFRIRFRNNKS
ncbi:MAG: PAS domain-containing sensor histidine kinase, partial [Muribaculaceae bacterium]|nr:PAS domain-containing sensor histidine kinase [Muribaculaceae bacterium]